MRLLRKRIFGQATLGEFLATPEIRLALLVLAVAVAAATTRGCLLQLP